LSRDDLPELQGRVVRLLGGGTMEIECDNGVVVRDVLCGKMKKYGIKVVQRGSREGRRLTVRDHPRSSDIPHEMTKDYAKDGSVYPACRET
jgi:hypothetical protein